MDGYEFTDRYGGSSGPNPETMCLGQCEGLGTYPVRDGDPDLSISESQAVASLKARGDTSEDGYFFIVCPECNGTGRRV